MTRDPRYDILFEPVRIGPVTARNRFYQVPHCTGIGWTQPETLARLRGIKAEGGWAVVATEETEIHPTADCEPFHEGRLWDDRDIPAMALMADAVHEHGALAAIEIMHHGGSAANWGTRLAPLAPSHRPIIYYSPVQARAMDKQDIRDLQPMAPRCGASLEEGRVRHRLRLCDPRSVDRAAIPRAPQERPDRRIWREPREPRAAAARADRGHEGGGRRPLRGCGPLCGRRADRRRRPDPRRRGARRRRDARRASGPVGRQHLDLAQRQPDLALRQGRLPGGIYELREAG